MEGIPFRSMTHVLQVMSRYKPLFGTHAPQTVERKLLKFADAQREVSSSQPDWTPSVLLIWGVSFTVLAQKPSFTACMSVATVMAVHVLRSDCISVLPK